MSYTYLNENQSTHCRILSSRLAVAANNVLHIYSNKCTIITQLTSNSSESDSAIQMHKRDKFEILSVLAITNGL